jgi:hypothetical protein
VGPGPYPTIQAAINDSNCDPINIPAGTFAENLNIARSLTVQGAGKTSTIINGGGTGRVVTINGAGLVVYINDLRVTGGNATSAASNPGFGGGILIAGGATLHGQNLQIDNNVASTGSSTGFGGGLAVRDGSAYLTGTMVFLNVAKGGGTAVTHQGQGGGLYAAGNLGAGRAILSLTNSQVTTNTAYNVASTARGAGGGLYVGDSNNTQVYLSGNTWQGNIARSSAANAGDGEGGAVAINPTTLTATVTIVNDNFVGNIANASNGTSTTDLARGGGISIDTITQGNVTINLANVSLTQNTAKSGSGTANGQGGAIYAENANMAYQGGTIAQNKAGTNGSDTGDGGGIRLLQAPLTASKLIIRDNMALENGSGTNRGRGGGIALFNGASTAGALSLVNSFVVDNITSNSGTREGAGLYINDPNLGEQSTLVHVTLASASVQPDQAVFVDSGSLGITNTIVTSHSTGLFSSGGDIDYDYVLFFGNGTNAAGSPPPNGGPNLFSGNPLFVNPASRDYHIQTGSQAINNGINVGVLDDIDGDTRPQESGFDIGADEFAVKKNYLPLIIKN